MQNTNRSHIIKTPFFLWSNHGHEDFRHPDSHLNVTTCLGLAAPSATTPVTAHPQLAAPSAPLPEAATPSAISDQAPSGQSSLFTSDVAPAKPKPGVYARGRHTQQVATAQLAKVTGGTRCVHLLRTHALQIAEFPALALLGWGICCWQVRHLLPTQQSWVWPCLYICMTLY